MDWLSHLDYGILQVRRITSESQNEVSRHRSRYSYAVFMAWTQVTHANNTADFDHSHTPKPTFSYFVSPWPLQQVSRISNRRHVHIHHPNKNQGLINSGGLKSNIIHLEHQFCWLELNLIWGMILIRLRNWGRRNNRLFSMRMVLPCLVRLRLPRWVPLYSSTSSCFPPPPASAPLDRETKSWRVVSRMFCSHAEGIKDCIWWSYPNCLWVSYPLSPISSLASYFLLSQLPLISEFTTPSPFSPADT